MVNKILLMTGLFCLLFAQSVFGQELLVKEFKELPNDLSARTQEKKDANDNTCALIKVFVPVQNASFEDSYLIDQQYTPGEYWVYMAGGASKIKVKHAEMPPIVFEFPEKLISKTTYQLVLGVKEAEAHYATFRVVSEVKNCLLYIGDQKYEVKKGQVDVKLPSGTYNYVVTDRDARHQPLEGTVEITDKDLVIPLRFNTGYTQGYLAEKAEKKQRRKEAWNEFWSNVKVSDSSNSSSSYSRSNYNTSNQWNSQARSYANTLQQPTRISNVSTYQNQQTRTNNKTVQPPTRNTNNTHQNQQTRTFNTVQQPTRNTNNTYQNQQTRTYNNTRIRPARRTIRGRR